MVVISIYISSLDDIIFVSEIVSGFLSADSEILVYYFFGLFSYFSYFALATGNYDYFWFPLIVLSY